jgi:hypothetical protein
VTEPKKIFLFYKRMSLLDSAHRVKPLGVAFYKAPSEVSSGGFSPANPGAKS